MVKKLKPDILCIQETKAKQHQSPVDLPEYDEFWNSAEKPGYSGVAIFTKPKPKKVIYDLPEDLVKKYNLKDEFGDPNKEGRVLTAEFDNFFVVNVYTPNSKPNLERLKLRHDSWDPAFLEFIIKLEKEKPTIVCGDFNVAHTENDLARPKENDGSTGFTKEEREGIDNIIKAGFIDSFRLFHKGNGYYTWWSHWGRARERNVGWRIDYIFISPKLKDKIKKAEIHPDIFGSDNCHVTLEIKL